MASQHRAPPHRREHRQHSRLGLRVRVRKSTPALNRYLEIDGERVAMENLTVAIVNGFDLPFYHDHSLWSQSQPRRMELRMLTVTATLPYDAAQDFESNYLQNRQVDNVRAVLATGAAGTIGAYDASLICEMTKGFQMSMPSPQGIGYDTANAKCGD